MAVFAVLFTFVIWFALFAGFLILSGYGLYRMAQHGGIPSPWMAFVPVASSYLTGLLAERAYYTYNGRVRKLAWWSVLTQLFPLVFLALYMVSFFRFASNPMAGEAEVLGLLPMFFLCFFSFLVPVALYGYCLYYIFRDYSPDNALLYTIVGVLFNIGFVFFLVERDTVPVSVTGFGAYPYGRPKYDRWHRWNRIPPQQYGPGGYPPQGGGPGTTGPGDYYRNR